MPGLGVGRRVDDDLAVLLAEAVEEAHAGVQEEPRLHVVGQGQIAGDLVDLPVMHDLDRVLHTVDRAGLQRQEEFRRGQGRRLHAESPPGVHVDVDARHPDLQALDVVDRIHLSLLGGQDARVAVEEGERAHAGLFGHVVGPALGGVAGQEGVQVVLVAPEEGQVDDRPFRVEVRDDLAVQGELGQAALKLLEHLAVLAEGGIRENLDGDLAAGLFFHLIGELDQRLVARIVDRCEMRQIDLAGIGLRRQRTAQKQGHRGRHHLHGHLLPRVSGPHMRKADRHDGCRWPLSRSPRSGPHYGRMLAHSSMHTLDCTERMRSDVR